MENKVMQLVKQICNVESTNCKSLNKKDLVRELMNLANVPQNADIQEVPVDWDNMVEVLFLLPDDNNYYNLFAGIGIDNNFHFGLSIIGNLLDNGYFHFFEEDGKKIKSYLLIILYQIII